MTEPPTAAGWQAVLQHRRRASPSLGQESRWPMAPAADPEAGMLQPLLTEDSANEVPRPSSDAEAPDAASGSACRVEGPGCTNIGGLCNIAVTAVGAGMLALPKAISTSGLLCGVAIVAIAAMLTYFSSSAIVRLAWREQKPSYAALVKAHFGTTGARVLQLAIIIHVAGVMLVYQIMLGDMLVGAAPSYRGLLPTVLGYADSGALPWWLCREPVVGGLLLLTAVPMLVARDLGLVSRYSRCSVVMLLLLAGTLLGLAGVALARGQAGDARLLPDPQLLESPLAAATVGLNVLAVSALAFTCQFNLISVHRSLADQRCCNMLSLTQRAIALCFLMYASVGVAGYTLFGSGTNGDVLANLNFSSVRVLVGKHAGRAIVYSIVLSNSFNLLVNTVLKVWAIRENVTELAWGKGAQALPAPAYYALTYGLLAGAFGLSIVCRSVYVVVSLVGSTACVTFSYVFPGLLLWKRSGSALQRAGGLAAVALAACMAALAVANFCTGRGLELGAALEL